MTTAIPRGLGAWHRLHQRHLHAGRADERRRLARFPREGGDHQRGLRFRARAWRETESEPEGWDFDYLDATDTRIESGTVGLYGEGPEVKTFSDLTITAGDGTGRWEEPKGADFLMGLLSRVPKGTPAIVLSHTPDIYEDAAALDVPLTLAGHTREGRSDCRSLARSSSTRAWGATGLQGSPGATGVSSMLPGVSAPAGCLRVSSRRPRPRSSR